MLIRETIDRECCLSKDLKKYKGQVEASLQGHEKFLYFCQHCGQLWRETTQMDAAGGTESINVRVLPS